MLLADFKTLIYMDYSNALMNKEEEEGKGGAKPESQEREWEIKI